MFLYLAPEKKAWPPGGTLGVQYKELFFLTRNKINFSFHVLNTNAPT
jgi:hypothetical protein